MNSVEIIKVRNGYVVKPPYDRQKSYDDPTYFYVFQTYQALVDKLQEIMEQNDGVDK